MSGAASMDVVERRPDPGAPMQHSAGAAAQGQKKKGKRKAVTLAEEHNTVHLIPSNAANRAAKRARTDADEVAPADAPVDAETGKRIEGYSLDSDDEDEEAAAVVKSRYVLQDEDEHEELDEEFQDGGSRVTAFNLEEEEEDGYFDASGNYFENKKDDSHEGDNWLETAGQYVAKPKKAIVPNFAEPTADPEKRDRCNLLTGMLKHLQARETVQQAMRRLGGQPPSGQRRWKKKEAKGGASAAAAAPSGVDDAAFSDLTACTDELLADGEFDVYSYSYEKVAYEIKELVAAKAAGAPADDNGPKFEYKWSQDALEAYGPYTATQMLEWQGKGFFKEGVVCREIKEGQDTTWYSSKRVDFDLYID